MTTARYRCRTCNLVHEGFPDLTFAAPYFFDQLSEADRTSLAFLNSDLCVINKEDYFVRAVLQIPILDSSETFGWGIWVSLSATNFNRYLGSFEKDPPPGEGPYFGWFSNQLPWYPDTLGLKTNVHPQPAGDRPLVIVEHTDHPLAHHQHHGIDYHELSEIVAAAKTPGLLRTPAV